MSKEHRPLCALCGRPFDPEAKGATKTMGPTCAQRSGRRERNSPLLKEVRELTQAKGVTRTAESSKLAREHIYEATRPNANPTLKTLTDLCQASGAELAIYRGSKRLKGTITDCLRVEIQKFGKVSHFAKESGLTREHIYEALGPKGNPRLHTLLDICRVLGLDLRATRKAKS